MEDPLVRYQATVEKLHYLNYVVVEVPPAILEQLPDNNGKGGLSQRLIIRVDERVQWQCGLMAKGEGSAYITIHAGRLKELGKEVGDDVSIELFPDDSEFGVEVAEEILAFWEQEPESYRRFMLLIPSVQRYMLTHVLAVKSPEKRAERTVLLLGNLLRSREGTETFRELLGKS